MVKVKEMMKKAKKRVGEVRHFKQNENMYNTAQIKIKKAWLKYNSRMRNKYGVVIRAAPMLIQSSVINRAKKILKTFIQDLYLNIGLILKGRQFVSRVSKIQDHFREHHTNNILRLQHLEVLYKSELCKLQMALFLKKALSKEK